MFPSRKAPLAFISIMVGPDVWSKAYCLLTWVSSVAVVSPVPLALGLDPFLGLCSFQVHLNCNR